MYVYKTSYHAIHIPTYEKRNLILPTIKDDDANEILYFTLYIIPVHMQIAFAFSLDTFNVDYTEKVDCNFYITSADEMYVENIEAINKFIPEHYKSVVAYSPHVGIKTIATFDSLESLLNVFSSVYVRFSNFRTKNYEYRNTASSQNTIHCEDEIVLYKNFNKRDTLNLHHAKFSNNIYHVYMGYPVCVRNKVIILNSDWSILLESNSKIAHLFDGEIHFWLISLDYIFNGKTEQANDDYGATILRCNKLENIEIERIIQKFQEFDFNNISFTEKCVYSEDKYNKLLLFTGLITHEDSTPYNDIIQKFV